MCLRRDRCHAAMFRCLSCAHTAAAQEFWTTDDPAKAPCPTTNTPAQNHALYAPNVWEAVRLREKYNPHAVVLPVRGRHTADHRRCCSATGHRYRCGFAAAFHRAARACRCRANTRSRPIHCAQYVSWYNPCGVMCSADNIKDMVDVPAQLGAVCSCMRAIAISLRVVAPHYVSVRRLAGTRRTA